MFGPGYWELQRDAYLFCAPTEVGGTHPVILESLVAGNCVLVNDYRPNAETVGRRRASTSRARRACPTWRASSSGCWPIPSSWPATARRRWSGRSSTPGTRWRPAYEQLLLEVSDSSGHGPLPMERLEELERATAAAGSPVLAASAGS